MRTSAWSWRPWAPALLTAFLVFSGSASADEGGPSVEERAKAAEAFDEATAAYLAKDFELAAAWFERAYRTVPTSAALLQAARAHAKAGNWIRAGNLALELRDTHPGEASAVKVADAIIARATRDNVQVDVECESSCRLELDGALVRHMRFLASPDVEHGVKAAFETGETSTYFQAPAGSSKAMTLEAPAAPEPPPVPRWAFFSSLGATVALGAVTVWSGVDANRGVSAYEAAARTASSPGINGAGSPTPAERAQTLLDEGEKKERRTNILIGVTAAMGVTTAVLGVFTNWKGESREPKARKVEPAVGVARNGGTLTIRGTF
jgi:hypothetical protein